MLISELIERIIKKSPLGYVGGSRYLQVSPNLLSKILARSKPTDIKLKNGKTAIWSANEPNNEMRVVALADPPNSENEQPILIGRLVLIPKPRFPIGYAYQVHTITTHEQYALGHGQLSSEMYRRVLMPRPNGLGGILLAGGSQTPAGRKAWLHMAENIPGAEVSAYLTIDISAIEPTGTDARQQSYAAKFVENIMNIGGIFRGEWLNSGTQTRQAVYDFPVKKGYSELEPEIKSAIKIYTGEFNTNIDIRYDVGLMARWIG